MLDGAVEDDGGVHHRCRVKYGDRPGRTVPFLLLLELAKGEGEEEDDKDGEEDAVDTIQDAAVPRQN